MWKCETIWIIKGTKAYIIVWNAKDYLEKKWQELICIIYVEWVHFLSKPMLNNIHSSLRKLTKTQRHV